MQIYGICMVFKLLYIFSLYGVDEVNAWTKILRMRMKIEIRMHLKYKPH